MPEEVELVSISIFLIAELQLVKVFASVLENHGFVRIRERWRGDGAVHKKKVKNIMMINQFSTVFQKF